MITDILNMTPLGALANASGNVNKQNIIEAGGTVGVGIGSLIAMSSLLQTAGEGLHYSIGGERVLATFRICLIGIESIYPNLALRKPNLFTGNFYTFLS